MSAVSVVVGVDGSGLAATAAAWAAREAALRHRPLDVVYAFDWPLLGTSMRTAPMLSLRAEAQDAVDDAVRRARDAAPGVTVRGEVRTGRPGALLAEASRRADVVVVGSHGRGRVGGALLGSTSRHLARHAFGPLVVVPPQAGGPTAGPVVLGADCLSASDAATGFAFREADLRHAPLLAVHAWRAPGSREPGDVLPAAHDVDDIAAEESRLLAECLSGWARRYPDVALLRRVVHGPAARALVDAARSADLLVVGPGAGGLRGLLGSVSRRVLHGATTAVAVVRGGP